MADSPIFGISCYPDSYGRSVLPAVRRGLKSPSHSESRLKPTEEPNQTIADFSPL
ncbi:MULTISPECIES: hypothetical protein [unclassified Microcoleus]|uniref:hypothetical protein n=1 Tax=unclassified Microcoleus TaxID=2642155 RepID=UPI0025F43C64|nr:MULTISPECIES: hypothetical protein [unclassified Microcoleus]